MWGLRVFLEGWVEGFGDWALGSGPGGVRFRLYNEQLRLELWV